MRVLSEIDLLGKGGEWAVGAARQQNTAEELLARFATGRRVQLLADEVGMGKTYVALAVAVSLLVNSATPAHPNHRVLVLTPGELVEAKWVREIAEFCGQLLDPAIARRISVRGRRADDPRSRTTLEALARPARGLEIIVGRFGVQGTLTSKLPDQNAHWGHAAHALVERGDIPGWKQWLRAQFPLGDEMPWLSRSIAALRNDETTVLRKGQPCRGNDLWADTEARLREGKHYKGRRWVQPLLNDLARAGYMRRMQPLDLVVVDEVHNWARGLNGMASVRELILPKTTRALGMTATPLQLETKNFITALQPFHHLADGPEGADHHHWPPLRALDHGLAEADRAATEFRRQWSMLDRTPDLDRDRMPELPAEHPFRRATQQLDAANRSLEATLGPWFIRHRRKRGHRWVFVGHEIPDRLPDSGPPSPEPHQLHAADGFPSDQAEVAQLALMRLSAIVAGEAGKPTLAASMTGCFSTIEASAREAKAIEKAAATIGRPYVDYIRKLARREAKGQRPFHPKLRHTVDLVEDAWLHGEKVLVFCVRKKTAEVLSHLIDQQLLPHLEAADYESMAAALRRELAPAVMDRVAQSLWLADLVDTPPQAVAAAISRPLSTSPEVTGLQSATNPTRANLEAVNDLANQLAAHHLLRSGASGPAKPWLEELAGSVEPDDFEWGAPVSAGTAHAAVVATLFAPSVLFGQIRAGREPGIRAQHQAFATALWEYGCDARRTGDAMGPARRKLLDVLARHLRSTTTLARLLGRRQTATGRLKVIVEQATRPYGNRRGGGGESLLARFTAFTVSAGALSNSNRTFLLREMQSELARSTVDLVKGGAPGKSARAFAAFNSPFTPDILVCTQVGDQGIDLHQFCRVVIHYDLTFNPARLEQRTGRCDRIGSKAARERAKLLVVLPLLAGSYDERIYASLLQRDQTNEALIGDISLTSEAALHDTTSSATTSSLESGVSHTADHQGPSLVRLPSALFDKVRPDFSVTVVEEAT